MDLKLIAKELGYKNIKHMLTENGMTHNLFRQLKEESQQDRITRIILDSFNVDTTKLIKILKRTPLDHEQDEA